MLKSAVILAAGPGRRAWPYTGVRQKTTLPILNTPIVRRLALDLAALGMDRIVVVTGHRAGAVRACLADLPGARFVTQKTLGDPVEAARLGLAEVEDPETLICAGDLVTTRENLADFAEAYAGGGCDAALMALPSPAADEVNYTTLEHDGGGSLTRVWARGDRAAPCFAGVAAGNTELLRHVCNHDPGIMPNVSIGAMPPLEGDLAYGFERLAREGRAVRVVLARDFVVDVDKPWRLLEANRLASEHFFAGLEAATLSPGAEIDDGADIPADARLWLGPGARIGKGVHVRGDAALGAGAQVLRGAILGERAVVGARSQVTDHGHLGPGAVLGADCAVAHAAEFDGMACDMVFMHHYCSVNGVLGTRVDIGAATVCATWRFDDRVREQRRDGFREQPGAFGNCCYIGDYSRTGVNAMLMPGVRVGWNCCIGPGVIVSDDVREGSLVMAKQEHAVRDWGPEKYGW